MENIDEKTEQLLKNYYNADEGLSWKVILQIFSIGYHKGQDDCLQEKEITDE